MTTRCGGSAGFHAAAVLPIDKNDCSVPKCSTVGAGCPLSPRLQAVQDLNQKTSGLQMSGGLFYHIQTLRSVPR